MRNILLSHKRKVFAYYQNREKGLLRMETLLLLYEGKIPL
jgi:hypothetical protein